MGQHAVTIAYLVQQVVSGEQGGISEAVDWEGGAASISALGEPVFDERGAISPRVRFETLASFIWLQETVFPLANRLKVVAWHRQRHCLLPALQRHLAISGLKAATC